MVSKHSLFKYSHGDVIKQYITDIKIANNPSENMLVRSNGVFTAFPWSSTIGGGGILQVVKANDYRKVTVGEAKYKGHRGPITDIEFSPFNDYLLATASEDAKINLWNLSDDYPSEDIMTASGVLKGDAKVLFAKFNPVADMTLASVEFKNAIKIWDVREQKEVSSIEHSFSIPTDIAWNRDGSLVSTVSKDKKIRIFDPRANSEVTSNDITHHGSKPQKMSWLGKHEKIVSTGFSPKGERQYAVWDPKKMNEPLTLNIFDKNSGIAYPYYEESTNLLFLIGRGELFIKYYEIKSVPPYVEFMNMYTTQVSHAWASLMPRRIVDAKSNEILRVVRCLTNKIEYIQFFLPKKAGGFQYDLYKNIPMGKPALSCEEWLGGQNKDPILEDIIPDNVFDGGEKKEEIEFPDRVDSPIKGEVDESLNNSDQVSELQNTISVKEDIILRQKSQIQTLEKTAEELHVQLQKQTKNTTEIDLIKKENEKLKLEMERYKGQIGDLNDELETIKTNFQETVDRYEEQIRLLQETPPTVEEPAVEEPNTEDEVTE